MNIDETIRDLFKRLEDRKNVVNKLRAETQRGWVTNCSWKIPFTATVINLQTLPEDQLYLVAGEIVKTAESIRIGQTVLGGELTDKIQGYKLSDWEADLRKRKATIEIRAEEVKLADVEAKLNTLLSPEEQRRIAVELLAKELSK